MGRSPYQSEKRRKELARLKKQEENRQRRQNKKTWMARTVTTWPLSRRSNSVWTGFRLSLNPRTRPPRVPTSLDAEEKDQGTGTPSDRPRDVPASSIVWVSGCGPAHDVRRKAHHVPASVSCPVVPEPAAYDPAASRFSILAHVSFSDRAVEYQRPGVLSRPRRSSPVFRTGNGHQRGSVRAKVPPALPSPLPGTTG